MIDVFKWWCIFRFSVLIWMHHHFLFKNKHMKKKDILKMFVGIILTPVLLAIYFVDRQILVFLPHLQLMTIRKWFDKGQNIMQSIIRIFAVVTITCFVQFIIWLF
jgi:hypothetical protein